MQHHNNIDNSVKIKPPVGRGFSFLGVAAFIAGAFLSPPLYAIELSTKVMLPNWEKKIINEVADEYGLQGDARLLLFVIRKVENGSHGREFGVLHPKAVNTSYRNQCQWAAGTIKKRYTGDLETFASRWCPIGAKNDSQGLNKYWYKNAKYYMEKWK